MAFIAYRPDISFNSKSLKRIEQALAIIKSNNEQGYRLSLRQLYYRMVSTIEDFENTEKSYKNFGNLIRNARYAGLIDWDAIEDRTRGLYGVGHSANPASIIEKAASSFRIDKWENQEIRPEVWVEKDALSAVVERPCVRNDVNYFPCKGYGSSSEYEEAAQRFVRYLKNKQTPVIIHLGDHDPSGIDMSRDITERVAEFVSHHIGQEVELRRIALNMNQVEQYELPPDPAKTTDVRYSSYVKRFGENSYELDALEPAALDALIEQAIVSLRDAEAWEEKVAEENAHRAALAKVSEHWEKIEKMVAAGKFDKKPRKRKGQ